MRTISEFLKDHERGKGDATISFKRFEEAFDKIARLQAALQRIDDEGMDNGGDWCAEFARSILATNQAHSK